MATSRRGHSLPSASDGCRLAGSRGTASRCGKRRADGVGAICWGFQPSRHRTTVANSLTTRSWRDFSKCDTPTWPEEAASAPYHAAKLNRKCVEALQRLNATWPNRLLIRRPTRRHGLRWPSARLSFDVRPIHFRYYAFEASSGFWICVQIRGEVHVIR